MSESEKCDYEIARYETALRGGHPEMEGLLQALQDWSAEKRLLETKFYPEPTGAS